MNLNKYNKINEEIKQFITDYQKTRILDIKKFHKLHEKLIQTVAYHRKDLALYEEIVLKMEEYFGRIKKGELDLLVGKDTGNYHHLLWKLHDRITRKKEHLKIGELPKYLREFNKKLKSDKYFFKEGENYFITTRIGEAVGHVSTIKISSHRVYIEYNDHSPSRTRFLQRRMGKKEFECSEISVMKEVFAKRDEGDKNYLFTCWKVHGRQEELEKDLLWFADTLTNAIDIDWLIIDSKSDIKEEEIENETKILELAFLMYDTFALKPKHFCDNLLTLLRINCNI